MLWRREVLLRALDACQADLRELRMAGDWRIYLECLRAPGAKIAYLADPLNVHRRHSASVTHTMKAQKHTHEIETVHRFAREAFGLSQREIGAQIRYIDEVASQLAKDSTETGRPKQAAKATTRKVLRQDS